MVVMIERMVDETCFKRKVGMESRLQRNEGFGNVIITCSRER